MVYFALTVTINDTSKKILFKTSTRGNTNCLKLSLQIGIDCLFNGTASNPDFKKSQVNNGGMKLSSKTVSSTQSSGKAVSNSKINTKMNLSTRINGPHRNQSVVQSNSILQQYQKYDKNKLSLSMIDNKPNSNPNTRLNNSQSQINSKYSPIEDSPLRTNSSIDSLINENKDEDIDIGDNVNSLMQGIIDTYNDNLLNK